jgi:Fe-Mn family superoxide dismutase
MTVKNHIVLLIGGTYTEAHSKKPKELFRMYTLPDLDYAYDALGRYISKDIMELHHDRHHQAYVDKLNAALEQAPDFANLPITELLTKLDELPDSIRTAVRNNGGGHYNHTEFWQWLSPDGGGQPAGRLGDQLAARYGSFQAFTDLFQEKALSVFGSGWDGL